MSAALELFPQLVEIVDFTVERDPDALVLIGHGLPSGGGKVKNAQAFVSETDRKAFGLEDNLPFIVRAAMSNRLAHTPKERCVNGFRLSNVTVNATHGDR
jgi:hypothetical protein